MGKVKPKEFITLQSIVVDANDKCMAGRIAYCQDDFLHLGPLRKYQGYKYLDPMIHTWCAVFNPSFELAFHELHGVWPWEK